MNSKYSLLLVVILAASAAYPAAAITRWFSSSFQDMRFTLKRFANCSGDLAPLTTSKLNESEYLLNQVRIFLDQTNLDNEQLANITVLMDKICQKKESYPVSPYINIAQYTGPENKSHRCRAIDDALDTMFSALKKASSNKSEPLDFAAITFYPNMNKTQSYNLTDLINLAWIQSNFTLESTCALTDSIKDNVLERSRNSTAQDRSTISTGSSYFSSIVEYIDRLLDPIFGFQRRLLWEGSNTLGQVFSSIGSTISSVSRGVGHGITSVRGRLGFNTTSV